MQSIDFSEIPAEGDRWGQFAREFMLELGFHVEPANGSAGSGNGANGGDFCATEQIQGKFNFHPFRWLVSPKHKAATRTAVRESEEADILERVLAARADAFLGFYSTPVSPALSASLSELKTKGLLLDYKFFDTKILEGHLALIGFSRLLARYFPNTAAQRHPLHLIEDEYLPLPCDHCGKDLLEALFKEGHKSVVARVAQRPVSEGDPTLVHDVYFACMGACDESLQNLHLQGRQRSVSSVAPLADIVVPPLYLGRILSLIDRLHSARIDYTEAALEKEKYLIRALAQRVLIDPTDGELVRARKMMFGPVAD